MKIVSMGDEFIREVGRADEREEAIGNSSQFCDSA
jgi:hypothetical protein